MRFAEAFLEVQGLIGFHRAEADRLFELAEALEGCGAPWTGGRELLELATRLRSLAETPEEPGPGALRGELRPYQRTGYGWLKALSDLGFGGVLADDMGLGKTVQTLALPAHRHLEEKTARPSLLVVPTSLVGNWRREAARFVPDLKLLVLHGPNRRRRFAEIPRCHLAVTTYPLVNRDHKALFQHEYDITVLDEAQTVKNPAAAVSKLIRGVRARQRLALTGTPIENSLQELWSLYDWLIPDLLGNRKSFTAYYRTPIEKQGDHARQRLLSIRIKPFLMRRTKEEVAQDLPEKTVIDEFVPLEGEQGALYKSIRTAMDARVREAIAERGLDAFRITILDALLKLRQVCCDPRLVKLDAARKVTESAKRARLLALLEELVAEGRKVLIFSQFVEMLRLVEADVATRGWGYAMLHGGTKDRDVQVENFQSEDLPLFLISLKAGGTGLNLTAADTVIVYDPWWNPAVERQAMDRAHRIGQDRPVFVHRLIAENTVESAIQRMRPVWRTAPQAGACGCTVRRNGPESADPYRRGHTRAFRQRLTALRGGLAGTGQPKNGTAQERDSPSVENGTAQVVPSPVRWYARRVRGRPRGEERHSGWKCRQAAHESCRIEAPAHTHWHTTCADHMPPLPPLTLMRAPRSCRRP